MKSFTIKIGVLLGAVAGIMGLASISSPAANAESSLLFGQKQAYTAIVRADQKVVTYAKIFLQNPEEKELKQSSFALPSGVGIANLSVHQILLPVRCQNKDTKPEPSPPLGSSYGYSGPLSCTELEKSAYEFDEYGYGYFGYSNESDSQFVYKKVALQKAGETYNITLPNPIGPQQRGAYLVSYIAEKGYVKGNLGLYGLEFKTLKVPDSIEEVRVAVDVASDLYTREKHSKIDSANTPTNLSAGVSNAKDSAIESKSLDKLQGSIGSGGTFTKTGKSLAPNEVFIVNGEFADAPWKLNLGWIAGGIVGLIVAIGLIALLLKKAQQQEIEHAEMRSKNGK